MGNAFFEIGNREVFKAAGNKLFAIDEKQIDNHISMLDMLHTCQLSMPTIIEVSYRLLARLLGKQTTKQMVK